MNQSRQVLRQKARKGFLPKATVYPRALYRKNKYLPHTHAPDGSVIMAKCLGGNHLI